MYNGGIGGDCVSHMVYRFDSDIKIKKPTYLICSFGMNDSGFDGYNKPGYDKYANQQVEYAHTEFEKLQRQILADKKIKSVVLLGSPPYDENVKLKGVEALHGKNETIKRIIEMQAEVAQKRGWGFVNFNTVMCGLNKQIQLSDSTATFCGGDRIHPDKDGHMVMAYLFLKAQGLAGQEIASFQINATNRKAMEERNCRISHIKNENDTISFRYLSRSLPFPIDTIPRWGTKGTARDAIRQIPFMQEMNQEIMKVTDLHGIFRVTIDGIEIGCWSGDELSKGVNLAEITCTPQYQQSLSIMYLNEERFEVEKRFREYLWTEYSFLKKEGLLFADDQKAIDKLKEYLPKDGFLRMSYDWYIKAMNPEIREVWSNYMKTIVETIYKINKPVTHKVRLARVE